MATATFIPVETYLRSSYEPDAEYVDGEIEERAVGEEWNISVFPELRVQVSSTRFRVPDVAILAFDRPAEQVITHPPIAVFEILSPEDTVHKVRRKLTDYAKMGIPQIWVIDPEDGASLRYLDGELLRGESFEEPSRGISFRIEEIGKLVRR
jgi:Uma2 family endonuclease